MATGLIFDIKRYAIHDGPGIRSTVFFKGCLLSCWWCHNPEGRSFSPELMIWPSRCIGCRTCVQVCPDSAVSVVENTIVTDRDKCKVCGVCAEKCPANAREIAGERVTVKDLMQEVKKDIPFYEESGGVTVSGGEPLAQPIFLEAFLSTCKKEGIHTAVDTSGYAEEEVLMKAIENVDLLLFDLKLMDDKEHRLYTGVSNKRILQNLELLDSLGKRIIIRFPLIPHINSDKGNVRTMCEYLSKLRNTKEVDILPYHKLGIGKARRLDRETMSFQNVPAGILDSISKLMKDFGLKVRIIG